MSYCAAQRLHFIDWCLVAHGEIQRADIMNQFEVSEAQASADLAAFDREHPGAMTYDKTRKRYVPARNPYRSKRGWNPAAINAMKQFCASGHPMAWGE